MLKAMSEAHHQVAVWGMLSQWNWLVSTWPISWFCRALMGNSGPSLFIKYGTTILEERIFLKKNDVGDYFDGEEKDMLDWFLAIGGRASSRSRLEYGEVLKASSKENKIYYSFRIVNSFLRTAFPSCESLFYSGIYIFNNAIYCLA